MKLVLTVEKAPCLAHQKKRRPTGRRIFPSADPTSAPLSVFSSIFSPGATSVCVVDERWALDTGLEQVSGQSESLLRVAQIDHGLVRRQGHTAGSAA